MKKMKSSIVIALMALFSSTPGVWSQTTDDIVDVASSLDSFTTLVTALQEAELVEALRGEGPFTVFAPTNDAFAALPDGTLDSLLLPENQQQLASILLYHVVPGNFVAADVAELSNATTLTSNELLVNFSVEGETVQINEATITQTDVQAGNGTIHVINQVILPPELGTIPETAEASGSFTTLLAALEATGLDETLSGDNLFTVFAPTDEAFGNLPEGTVENLLQEENLDQLRDILLYHVVPGKVIASEVVTLSEAGTVNGQTVSIEVIESGVMLNGNTNVTTVDIDTSNGVIHVIDSVLLPQTQSNTKLWDSY